MSSSQRTIVTGASKASAGFILATIALDALSFAIIIPVVPALVMQIGHLPAASASLWLGLIFSLFAFMQFLCAPIAGALSDRFGRRPVLLVSLTALGCNALLWTWVPSLGWLLVLRIIAGGLAGNITAATAYIADVTPPDGRARAFGLVGAMFGLGFVVGPALGGLLGSVWIRLPFLVSAGLIGINVVYGLLVLPESLPVERRRAFSWRRANPVGALSLFATGRQAAGLGVAWCCGWVALGAQQSSFILANQMRFGWSLDQNGLVLALGGLSQAVVQGLLVGRISAGIGPRRTALCGFGCAIAGYGLYALADRPWIMLLGVCVLAFGALSNPSIQSMLSIAAGPQRQGEVQGGLGSLQGLSMVIGPTLTGYGFTLATRPGAALHFPGAPFALAGVCCLVGLLAVALNPPAHPGGVAASLPSRPERV